MDAPPEDVLAPVVPAQSPEWTRHRRIAAYGGLGAAAFIILMALGWNYDFGTLPPQNAIAPDSPAMQAEPRTSEPGSGLPVAPTQDVTIVVGPAGNTPDPRAGETAYEIRSTPFSIDKSAIHYFHDADAEAAETLAAEFGAEVVDLRGFRPPPPSGRLVVHLADNDL